MRSNLIDRVGGVASCWRHAAGTTASRSGRLPRRRRRATCRPPRRHPPPRAPPARPAPRARPATPPRPRLPASRARSTRGARASRSPAPCTSRRPRFPSRLRRSTRRRRARSRSSGTRTTAAFALGGASFVGKQPTSPTLRLTFTVRSGRDAASFASDDGECDVIYDRGADDVRRHVQVHRPHRRAARSSSTPGHVQRHGVATDRAAASRTGTDLAWLAGSALVVLAVLLPVRPARVPLPLGPDVPVYLWWTRLGASQGLSRRRRPPGQPGALRDAGGRRAPAGRRGHRRARGRARRRVGSGSACSSARRAPWPASARVRAAWVLAGLLAGLFAVHLAAGYLANLAFAAPFLAAASASRRHAAGPVAAAIALGGGGLAHPLFFLLGALVLAASPRGRSRARRGWRSDAGRVAVAALGGGAIVAAACSRWRRPGAAGGRHVEGRVPAPGGLTDAVRHAYLDRPAPVDALRAVARAPAGGAGADADERLRAALPRGVGGARRRRRAGRPAHRLVPRRPVHHVRVLDPGARGLGVVGVWLWLERRVWLAALVAAALVGAMAAGALIAWSRQEPFISPLEVERATTAARIADTLPPARRSCSSWTRRTRP